MGRDGKMHHEKDVSQEIMSALKMAEMKQDIGPTRRFPGGKLTANDEGEIAFAVGILKRKVIINFGTPIASLGMSPKQAKQLAASLIEKANTVPAQKKRKRRHTKTGARAEQRMVK